MVPQEAVPQEAVPQEAVPQEVVPQEVVPQEVVPQEVVPQEVVHRVEGRGRAQSVDVRVDPHLSWVSSDCGGQNQ